jgi:hypothetical protein
MATALEDLYRILKKNVESLNIEDLSNTSFYTEEYDEAVFLYLNESKDKTDWMKRYREIRDMEKGISQFLAEHLQTLMRRTLGGLGLK